jgi:hypothetical protein
MAVERASWLSVLSEWLLSNSRTRAAIFGGTSSTVSPAVTSCWASSAPVPVAPSTAHTGGSNPGRPAQQTLLLLAVGAQVQHRPQTFLLVEGGGGVRTAVRIDPDHKHGFLLIVVGVPRRADLMRW